MINDASNRDSVLLVDDELHVLESLRRVLRDNHADVLTARSGTDAVKIIESTPIATIISDQHMPDITGAELLSRVRSIQPNTPRIMLTGSAQLTVAMAGVNEGGADHILLKPWADNHVRSLVCDSIEIYRQRMACLHRDANVRIQRDELFDLNDDLNRRIELTVAELASTHDDLLNVLVVALDCRERQSAGHSHRVALYCLYLAMQLGLDASKLEAVYRGGLLHDIGKIGVPDAVLLKPGPLNTEERKLIEQHVEFGYRILRQVECLRSSMCIPLFHHERVDGNGYPRQLIGDAIPIEAKAFAIIDCYDALRSARPYKQPISHEESCRIISADANSRFDPSIIDEFLEISPIVWEHLAREATAVRSYSDALAACKSVSVASHQNDLSPL